MKHIKLINGEGLRTGAASDDPGRRAEIFARSVMAGSFQLEDDPSGAIAQSCLCSRGADECYHCGRQSKS